MEECPAQKVEEKNKIQPKTEDPRTKKSMNNACNDYTDNV
jgi:hypothetical protein